METHARTFPAAVLGALVVVFVLAALLILGPPSNAAAPDPETAPDAALQAGTATPTAVNNAVCQVGGRKAEYPQTAGGVTVQPIEQHDAPGGYTQWLTTWRFTADPGRVINAEWVTYRCVGNGRDPSGYDQCPPNRATISATHTLSFTIPVSGAIDVTVRDDVDCCELDEIELLRVNGIAWRSSFFIRWAEAPVCPIPKTATPTVTPSPTATPVFFKEPWHDTLSPGYSQRYNIVLHNTSGALLRGVVVTDTIPAESRFSDATIVVSGAVAPQQFSWYAPGGTWDGMRTVVWQVGDLPAGHYASMKVHVFALTTAPVGATIINTAAMSAAGSPAITSSAGTLIVAVPATATPTNTPTPTPTRVCPAVPLVLVDTGSAASYTDSQGRTWQADRALSPGLPWGYVGDSQTYVTAAPIGGASDDTLYQTERWWGNYGGGYRFTVPNGDYEVYLKLAEIYPYAVEGSRVFTIRAEGVTLAEHLDVARLAGLNTAYDIAHTVHVADGVLNVDVIAEQGNPSLKAIGVFDLPPCTPTPTATAQPSVTFTATSTPIATETATPTASPTSTSTATQQADTPTVTATPQADTPTPTATATEATPPTGYRVWLPIIIWEAP